MEAKAGTWSSLTDACGGQPQKKKNHKKISVSLCDTLPQYNNSVNIPKSEDRLSERKPENLQKQSRKIGEARIRGVHGTADISLELDLTFLLECSDDEELNKGIMEKLKELEKEGENKNESEDTAI